MLETKLGKSGCGYIKMSIESDWDWVGLWLTLLAYELQIDFAYAFLQPIFRQCAKTDI